MHVSPVLHGPQPGGERQRARLPAVCHGALLPHERRHRHGHLHAAERHQRVEPQPGYAPLLTNPLYSLSQVEVRGPDLKLGEGIVRAAQLWGKKS